MTRPVAFVTGGTRGIGLGIAQQLAQSGFDLAINGRREAEAESVRAAKEAIESRGAACLYVRGDVADLDGHEAMLGSIRERYGRLDTLVNNAGVAPNERADLLDASPESFDRLISINLRGPYFLTQRVCRWFRDEPAGDDAHRSVTFVTSVSATMASTNRGEYCVSKAGLAMSARLFAARMGELGVPVYEVRPGVIKTDMTSGVTEKYDAMFADGAAIDRRWGTPEDVGRVVASLARGDMPYATGQAIMVDGGLSTPRL